MATKRKREEPEVTDANRAQISKKLEEFSASTDKKHTFEASLTSNERQVVHIASKKLGLTSKSSGEDNRRVSVYKKEKAECTPQKVKCTPQRKVKFKPKKNVMWERYGRGKRLRVKNTENKTKGQKAETVAENLSHFTLSEEGKTVLQNLFMYYPPHDGEMEKKMFGSLSKRTAKRRHTGDDIFSKPLLKKEEIAKKLKALDNEKEKDANLRQITQTRAKLPIALFENVIVSTVESHQVVLISGETGCGKTTQVPQYLLDHMWGRGETCKIVCTQPRRISATSVAERISAERGENIGNDIGYTIRLDKKGGKHSSVVFCTNGVLLQVLVSGGSDRLKSGASKPSANDAISNLTHIIVDEIHERDRYSDFMLTILRDVLPLYPHLRLILMSATLDAERFSEYFGGCPIISVPGFTYPVKTFYLEDILFIVKSAENKPDSAALAVPMEGPKLTEEDKVALDEAINLAWSNDEFGPLLDFVSSEGSTNVFNYQHSLTGLTPLMVFAGKGRVGDICMLLCLGVDCTLKAKDGTTALVLAERENQQEAADVIKKHMEGSNNVEELQLLAKYLEKANPALVDVALIVQLLVKICSSSKEGAILVFLPGWDEINRTRDKLLANSFFKEDPSRFMILPLHSMVPAADQKMVFRRPDKGCRKIVLSTNMAETSITIDDIVYVIDSGQMKEKSYDPECNVSTLQTSWVSKANAKQRAGRAGRCQPGICYHMYSKSQAASLLDYQIPEIKRVPIEELCLQVKLIDPNCNIAEFLYKTLDPPLPKTISNAITVLQEVGALTIDEKLTELGEKLGSLPVHPLTGRMLFFSILLKCLDPALTLACALDLKDPFIFPMSEIGRKKSDEGKKAFAALYGGQSDQLAVVAAFDCYKAAKQKGMAAEFCSQFFLSTTTMKMLFGMRKKLQIELTTQGFIPHDVSGYSVNARDPGILHALLVAGSYPMVGRLRPPQHGRRHIELVNGDRVRLHPKSENSKLSLMESKDCPTFVFDEITRGDFGTVIRKCTVIGPLPLLLFAADIAVAPAEGDKKDDTEADKNNITKDGMEAEKNVNKEDGMDVDKKDNKELMDVESKAELSNEEKIMSSSDNSVIVYVDNWLNYKSTALEVAQIYCLKDRLAAAIWYTATSQGRILPPVLDDSASAIAFLLSRDGLCGIPELLDPDSTALRPKSTRIAAINAAAVAPKPTGDANESALAKRDMANSLTDFLASLLRYENNPSTSQKKSPSPEPVTRARVPSLPNGFGPGPVTRARARVPSLPKPVSDQSQSSKSSASKPPAKPASLVGYSATRFGPGPVTRVPSLPKPVSDQSQSSKSSASKPLAKPASLVGYGATRFGPGPVTRARARVPSLPKPVSDQSQSSKSSASKPPAKPASLVGYGATRFGPYGLKGDPGPAKRQKTAGARRW